MKKTKTGIEVETQYCRSCMKDLPPNRFYDCADAGFFDTNGLMSVCKECIQDKYDEVYAENKSMEATLQRLCTALNIRFSNDAVDATRKHIETLMDNGKNVKAIFSIYKMKLTATRKSMTKQGLVDMSYEDVGVIYKSKELDVTEIPIPKEVIDRWGVNPTTLDDRDSILYLEQKYINFKQTHKADTYTEQVLLQQICFTLLDIQKARQINDDTSKLTKSLQDLMKSAEVSPNAISGTNQPKDEIALGLWIKDVEEYEPAEWLKSSPLGNLYRDVADTEEYGRKFISRPIKNLITGSKDFNIDDETMDDGFEYDEDLDILGMNEEEAEG